MYVWLGSVWEWMMDGGWVNERGEEMECDKMGGESTYCKVAAGSFDDSDHCLKIHVMKLLRAVNGLNEVRVMAHSR